MALLLLSCDAWAEKGFTTYQTTTALLSCGVSEDRIGVITLYRQQIKLLEDLLGQYKGVEILTADKSQGRDKDCIVMSLTRSNAEKHVSCHVLAASCVSESTHTEHLYRLEI